MMCLLFFVFAVITAGMFVPVIVGDEEIRRLKKKGVIK